MNFHDNNRERPQWNTVKEIRSDKAIVLINRRGDNPHYSLQLSGLVRKKRFEDDSDSESEEHTTRFVQIFTNRQESLDFQGDCPYNYTIDESVLFLIQSAMDWIKEDTKTIAQLQWDKQNAREESYLNWAGPPKKGRKNKKRKVK